LLGFPTPYSYIQATLKTYNMKIEKTTPRPFFQPITIQITIESEEELIALQTISRLNVSIPELVSDDTIQQEIIYEFLNEIHSELGKCW
jgi:hypothetical protein